jgi:hypothetical protein
MTMTQGIKLVIIMQVSLTATKSSIIKADSINVVPMVELTTKDFCQAIYYEKGKIIFHTKS